MDVVAPGENLASATIGSGYAVATDISGTSMAAPQVAGIAALILSKFPDMSRQDVVDLITVTASRYPNRTNELGYGLVDAYRALFGDLRISGPEGNQLANNYFTYRVSTPPVGVVFTGWSVRHYGGGTYTINGSPSGSTLNIKFTVDPQDPRGIATYYLTAKFRLPNGYIHSIERPVNIIPDAPLTPVVMSHWADFGAVFTVINHTVGAVYQWQLDEDILTHPNANYPYLEIDIDGDPIISDWPFQPLSTPVIPSFVSSDTSTFAAATLFSHAARCRAQINGVWSPWSNQAPINYTY